jgi:hypothetical protein
MVSRSLTTFAFAMSVITGTPAFAGLPAYNLELKDGALNPEVIEVNAGERFKLNIQNTGKGPVEFESTRLRQEKVLGPGASSFVVIPPLKPGTYEFFDEFHLPDATGQIIAK